LLRVVGRGEELLVDHVALSDPTPKIEMHRHSFLGQLSIASTAKCPGVFGKLLTARNGGLCSSIPMPPNGGSKNQIHILLIC
ncbi:hypothetical protein PENTCL1PPCAC_20353, partial [Pristionchus entomophagus]